MLLKNGCICCTVRGDIADTLETAVAAARGRHAAAVPPHRDRDDRPRRSRAGGARAAGGAGGRTLCVPAGRHRHDGGRAARRGAARSAAGGAAAGRDGGSHPADQDRSRKRRRHRIGRGAHRRSERERAGAACRQRGCGCGRRVRSRAGRRRERCQARAMAAGVRDRPAAWPSCITRSAMATTSVPWCCAATGRSRGRYCSFGWSLCCRCGASDVLRLKGLVRRDRRGPAGGAAGRASRAAPAGVSRAAGGECGCDADRADHAWAFGSGPPREFRSVDRGVENLSHGVGEVGAKRRVSVIGPLRIDNTVPTRSPSPSAQGRLDLSRAKRGRGLLNLHPRVVEARALGQVGAHVG